MTLNIILFDNSLDCSFICLLINSARILIGIAKKMQISLQ